MSEPKNCLVCGEPIPRRAYQASWVRTCGPVCASDLAHRENPDLDRKYAQKKSIPGLDGGAS